MGLCGRARVQQGRLHHSAQGSLCPRHSAHYRRHVVMIDRASPDHIVSYDEVTTMTDPDNALNTFDVATTYITNFNEETAATVDDDILSRGRRLEQADDIFHAHLRSKIRGFPNVFIHEAILGHNLAKLPEHVERRLADDDGDDDALAEVVTLDTTLTTSNSNSLVDISNRTLAEEQEIINSTTIELLESDSFAGSVVAMPTNMSDSQPDDLSEPEASFGGLTITAVDGLIQWPTAADSVDLDEFNDVAIVQRSLLQQWMEENNDPDADETAEDASVDYNPPTDDSVDDDNIFGRKLPDSGLSEPKTFTSGLKKKSAAKLKVEEALRGLRTTLRDIDLADQQLEERETHHRSLQAHFGDSGWNSTSDAQFDLVASSHRQLGYSISSTKKFKKIMKSWIVTSIQTKADNLRAYILDKTSAYNMAVDYYDGYPYEDLIRPDCGELHTQLARLYDHIDVFVLDNQKKINDQGKLAKAHLDYTQDLEDSLDKLENVVTVLQPAMPVISKLPYAGAAFKVFYELYSSLIKLTVKPANTVLSNVNTRITSLEFKSKLDTLMDANEDLAKKILKARDTLMDNVNDLVKVDAICPDTVGTVTAPRCAEIAPIVESLNDELDNFSDEVSAFAEFLDQQLSPTVKKCYKFKKSSLWKSAKSVLKKVDAAFSAINSVLEYEIKTCLPFICWKTQVVCVGITYPCGVKTCSKKIFGKKIKYPCGTTYCATTACVNVPVPYTCSLCAQFSVEDIISGVMNALDPLESALTSLMKTIANGLDINIPEIEIPGVPETDTLSSVDLNIETHFDFEFPDSLINAVDDFRTYLSSVANTPSC